MYVGVDGGGSKTQVFVLDDESQRGVTCVGHASNPNSVGWDAALAAIESLIGQCLRSMGAQAGDVCGLSVCMSGVDRPEQVAAIRKRITQNFSGRSVEVANDALAALAAGTGGTPGIVLIAGTGSIAVGESASGNTVRAGGFGYLIGDEGSGFHIGRAGIMAAIQSAEGRGPHTVLWEQLRDAFHLRQPSDVIDAVYQSSYPVQKVASFAKRVIESAAVDPVAEAILDDAVRHQASLVRSIQDQLIQHQLADDALQQLVLSGGIFTSNDVLTERLQHRLPDVQCQVLRVCAASGAALRAALCHRRMSGNGNWPDPAWMEGWRRAARNPQEIADPSSDVDAGQSTMVSLEGM